MHWDAIKAKLVAIGEEQRQELMGTRPLSEKIAEALEQSEADNRQLRDDVRIDADIANQPCTI